MLEKLTEKAAEALYMNPGMHIESNREIMIENCRRIEEYNDIYNESSNNPKVLEITPSPTTVLEVDKTYDVSIKSDGSLELSNNAEKDYKRINIGLVVFLTMILSRTPNSLQNPSIRYHPY